MVLGLNLITNNTLNLLGIDCCKAVNTRDLGPMESPMGLTMECYQLKKKKKKRHIVACSYLMWFD